VDISEEVDFTHTAAAAPPSAERVALARQEADAGTPQLRDSGFLVSIARQARHVVPPKNGSRYVMLVIEDDGDLAQLLIDIFILSGYEVRWASNREEINAALKRADEIDAILLDVLLRMRTG
jgi:PleD family two-component response regulator